jgi:hypothetical protein
MARLDCPVWRDQEQSFLTVVKATRTNNSHILGSPLGIKIDLSVSAAPYSHHVPVYSDNAARYTWRKQSGCPLPLGNLRHINVDVPKIFWSRGARDPARVESNYTRHIPATLEFLARSSSGKSGGVEKCNLLVYCIAEFVARNSRPPE